MGNGLRKRKENKMAYVVITFGVMFVLLMIQLWMICRLEDKLDRLDRILAEHLKEHHIKGVWKRQEDTDWKGKEDK